MATLARSTGDIGAFWGDIGAFYGDIGPFYGDIGAFWGDIGAFYGDIGPFYGDIGAFWGDIGAFYGDIGPFYGDIGAFWGDIGAFYGDIGPFYGDIGAFWGDIGAFYGDIGAFYGDIDAFYGDIGAFWGDIGAFWGDIGPFWGDINAFWGDIGAFTSDDYAALAADLNTVFDRAEALFGPIVESTTGQSFEDAILTDLNARFGINVDDPQSLASVTAEQRSAYFLALYDALMAFSGRDHVDHWMGAVNWSPAVAWEAGAGRGVHVGLVDFPLVNSFGDGGVNHGLAVASLVGASHNGFGAMGVAPRARIWVSNPFDETLTTNWTDVRESVADLVWFSDIVNLSLGLPGWTFNDGWAEVLSHETVRDHADDALFVFAAGNDGVTQTADVDWSAVGAVDNLLIVGSVNPAGEISSFSNRPGEACLTTGGVCAEGGRLMDRFLVAPGEMLFVPDGQGGYTRMSGTSFAAPLVSGAAALVKSEWSWLDGGDVAEVLLSTAQDLGAPGVDPVYGHGLLDIGAAMAPINADELYFRGRFGWRMPAQRAGLLFSRLGFRDDLSITVFEDLRDTVRDFEFSLAELTLDAGAAMRAPGSHRPELCR
jgi:subtilisin family serine protease